MRLYLFIFCNLCILFNLSALDIGKMKAQEFMTEEIQKYYTQMFQDTMEIYKIKTESSKMIDSIRQIVDKHIQVFFERLKPSENILYFNNTNLKWMEFKNKMLNEISTLIKKFFPECNFITIDRTYPFNIYTVTVLGWKDSAFTYKVFNKDKTIVVKKHNDEYLQISGNMEIDPESKMIKSITHSEFNRHRSDSPLKDSLYLSKMNPIKRIEVATTLSAIDPQLINQTINVNNKLKIWFTECGLEKCMDLLEQKVGIGKTLFIQYLLKSFEKYLKKNEIFLSMKEKFNFVNHFLNFISEKGVKDSFLDKEIHEQINYFIGYLNIKRAKQKDIPQKKIPLLTENQFIGLNTDIIVWDREKAYALRELVKNLKDQSNLEAYQQVKNIESIERFKLSDAQKKELEEKKSALYKESMEKPNIKVTFVQKLALNKSGKIKWTKEFSLNDENTVVSTIKEFIENFQKKETYN